ncbi:MAG: iron export ABC transporter permease subunit FetB [Gammaproteobacteria bacterium]|nr:iron export ABC transporter permease subunit FetB [Gammaproteobacteria bacterium]
MDTLSIDIFDLGLAAVLVVFLAAIMLPISLGLSRSIIIAAARTCIQLMLIGLILKIVFASARLDWVIAIAMVMLLVAGREVMVRQEHRFSGWWGYGLGTFSMFLSSFLVTLIALLVIISPHPWYEPRYAIPLLGMILGNTMTGVALAVNNLTRAAVHEQAKIEARLMLGYGPQVALSDIRRQSIHSGLIPIVNAMAAAGIVSLPGMMTGQILAGVPPIEAVKYQILIMFMIAAGSGFGTLGAVWLGSRRLFDERHRLRLDRLRSRGNGGFTRRHG